MIARSTLWCMAVAILLSCSTEDNGLRSDPIASGEPTAPSVLLITLDTTRADYIGYESAGSESSPTPSLDSLAAEGMRFSQAYSTVPLTLPAHASMLTGLYPSEHGLHENSRYLARDVAVWKEI